MVPALERREFEESVLGDERDAETLGVRGVPAFIADCRAMVSSVQPVETLRQLIARARRHLG